VTPPPYPTIEEASGLSDAAAFGEVLEHGASLLLGQVSLEQGRALALGEAVFACQQRPNTEPLSQSQLSHSAIT
jgi:hypothetical protein